MKTKIKNFLKKTVAVVLSAVMFAGVTEIGIGTTATANATGISENDNNGISTHSDISMNSTNSFGNLLSQEVSNQGIEESKTAGYKIFSAEVTENKVFVEFQTLESGTLIAAIYDESGTKLISTGKTDIKAEDTNAEITLDTNDMPEYFYLRVFLVDSTTLRPICKVYDCPNYTKEMQDFLAKTTDDFDSDLVLNLDDDKTNNFAVYSGETKVIPESKANNVVSADDESGVYVFENIDDNISALKSGDIFAYEYGDDGIIIVKVDNITIDGKKATITSQETSMEEVFDYVKIDENCDSSEVTVDTSNLDEGITYEGKVDSNTDNGIMPCAWDIGGSIQREDKFSINKEYGDETNNAKLGLDLKLKLNASIKLYLSLSNTYFEFNLDYSATADLSLSTNGMLSKELPLGEFGFAICPGLYVGLTPSVVLEASVSMNIEGTIEGSLGMRVTGQGIENISKPPTFKPEFKIEGTLFIGLSLEPKVKVLSEKIAQVSVKASLGAEVKASYSVIKPEEKDVIHECKNCLDGDISFKMTLDLKVKLANNDKLSFNLSLAGINKHLFDFYYSFDFNEFDFTECPHKKYRLEIKAVDQSLNAVEGATVEVNGNKYNTGSNGIAVLEVHAEPLTIYVHKDGVGSDTRKSFNIKNGKNFVTMVLALQDNHRLNHGLTDMNFGKNACQYNGHTYQIFDEGITWSEAKEKCEEMGGYLATISNEGEEEIIENLIQFGNKFFYWLGGTDEEEEGNWKWITGETWEYQNWCVGQPDNCSGKDFEAENFLTVEAERRGWNDLQICGDSYGESSLESSGFVCEWEPMDKMYLKFNFINNKMAKVGSLNSIDFANIANTREINTKTRQFLSLTPSCTYNFYVVQTRYTNDILSNENLLYVSQAVADENGNLTVSYDTEKYFETEECFVIQAEQTDISNAEIKLDDLTADGTEQYAEPVVTVDGETLINGIDYDIAGEYKVKDLGEYTITIYGIGMYNGEKTVVFKVLGEPVSNIYLNKTALTLEKGNTETLTATITPDNATDKTVSWSTTNSDVATVTDGIVTAVGTGTATITAKTSNGKKAECTVTVTEPLANESAISATETNLGQSVTMTAKATGGTAPYKYRYFCKPAGAKSYTALTGTTTATTYTHKPARAISYSYAVKIADAKGKTTTKYFTVKVNPAALKNTSTISATNITLGQSITMTAKATGGTAPYKYRYFCKPAGAKSYTALTNTTTATTFTHKPARAISYSYAVKIADAKGKTETKYFTVNVSAPLANVSTISATSINLGSSIKLTAKATGGTAPYKYRYYCKPAGAKSYTALTNVTTSATYTHKPAKAITYSYAVKIADAQGKIVTKFFTVKVNAPLANVSTISATSINLGSSIKLTAKATGGTAPYKYRYYCKPAGAKSYTALTNVTTSATYTHKPARAITYSYAVKIADANGKIVTKFFTVKVNPAALKNVSTISATSINLGSSIKLTAKATGGTAPYKYRYYCKPAGAKSYTALTNVTTSATYTHKPAKAITYSYAVKIADAKGKIITKFFTVKVNSTALANVSTISATSINLGSSIKLTAKATGGTAPYKYRYYCKPAGAKSYTALTNVTTSATYTHKPAKAITYSYAVKIADAKGKIVTKFFTVKVK